MKICIVSSCGGHLTEVRCLLSVYSKYKHFYVINHEIHLPTDMRDKTYFIKHSERDLLFFVNVLEAFTILRREKPKIIISTGAGPIVPFALVGKLIFGAKIIFIETITRVKKPSLTGRIMYKIADEFYYQWETLSTYYPKGHFYGTLL